MDVGRKGSLSVYGLLSLMQRFGQTVGGGASHDGRGGVNEVILLGVCLGVIYSVMKVLRAIYTPAMRLTASALEVRRLRGYQRYHFDQMESLATFGEIHSPTTTNSSTPTQPLVVDYLLVRGSARVVWLVLPQNRSEQIIDSIERRTGKSVLELEDARQAKRWAKGRLHDVSA